MSDRCCPLKAAAPSRRSLVPDLRWELPLASRPATLPGIPPCTHPAATRAQRAHSPRAWLIPLVAGAVG